MAEPVPKNQNIHAGAAGSLKWDRNDACASLDAVLASVEQEANKSIEWYWKNKRWKATLSRTIQFSAVILAALAGLLPILYQIGRAPNTPPSADPGLWASVLVGTVAALIGLDRAFGFSSGWTRYVLTATAIRKALEEFRLEWAGMLSDAGPCPNPPPDKVAKMLQRAKDFSSTIEALVLQETKEWATEFQSNISQFEKDAKSHLDALRAEVEQARLAQKAASETGALELTVNNASGIDGGVFHVRLQGTAGVIREDDVSNSAKWVEISIPVGQYKVLVTAKRAGKAIGDAVVVSIKVNETARVPVTLPA